jgi:spermidine synthase
MLATNSLQTPVLGLVGRADGQRFEATQLHARIANAARSQGPAAFGLPDELSVLGSFIAGPRALRQFASDAPVNTDDRPVVAYIAPRITYAPDSSPADRLLALLRQVDLSPQELIAPDASAQTASRLSAYWQARNRFLVVGRGVRPERDVRRMLAQVREPLLGVLRISPDFRPAYEPLQRMAAALAQVDEAGARALQAQLRERAEAVSPPL